MASPPTSTKTSLGQKLRARARERWPQLTGIDVRFRGQFAYVTGQLPGGEELPLCRLRYVGYASSWGFAIYRASHDDYHDSYLPSGQPSGTPAEALDCACGLYLADPTAWLPPGTDTPTNLRARPLVTCGGPFDGTSGHYLDNIIVYAHLVHGISAWGSRAAGLLTALPALLCRRSACLTA